LPICALNEDSVQTRISSQLLCIIVLFFVKIWKIKTHTAVTGGVDELQAESEASYVREVRVKCDSHLVANEI